MSALETAQESKDSHPAGCELDNAVGILKLKLETEFIQPLPPPAANLAGSSSVSGRDYRVTVSNKAGYLCHVQVETRWPVPPEVPFGIFTYPDNSALFRDVKRVGARKVLKTEPGYKEVEVEQLGEVQVLWMHRTYSTWLHVVEDSRDPECLRITFDLVRSDVLGRFSGQWELRPVVDPSSGLVVGCRGELNQDVLPKGVPSFMARLPVLGGALRGISVRAITRVLEDSEAALEKVRAGHAAGRTTEAVLRELCGTFSEVAHANGTVKSFQFDAEAEENEDNSAEEPKQGERSCPGPAQALDLKQPTELLIRDPSNVELAAGQAPMEPSASLSGPPFSEVAGDSDGKAL